MASMELDLVEGSSSIGQLTVKIIDKRLTSTNQNTGWFTAQLAGATINGLKYGQLIGHRALLEQVDSATGTWYVVMNGIIGDVSLDDDMVTYSLPIRDMRERERATPAFNRTNGTVSLYPPGLTINYGQLGGFSFFAGSKYLITATPGVRATFRKKIGENFGIAWQLGRTAFGPGQPDRLTQEQAGFLQSNASVIIQDLVANLPRFTHVGIRWRPWGSTGAWTILKDMPVYKSGETGYANGGSVIDLTPDQRDETFYINSSFYLATDNGSNLPADLDSIEIQAVYFGPPRAEAPIYIEVSFGQLLKDLYDGAYSSENPRIPYDAAAMATFVTSTPMARVKVTEMKEDIRKWTEENIYKPLGYAPALNAKGEIVPVKYNLPDVSVTPVQLDDTNIIEASWSHSYKDAVNKTIFKYIRESRPQTSNTTDMPRGPYFSTVLDETEVEIDNLHSSISVLGPQTVTYEPETLRVFEFFRGSAAATGNVKDELGFQLSQQRSKELFDRFSYGAQKLTCSVIRANANIRGLKIGDWVTIACSWLPNYSTGVRGINRIAQIIGLQDVDPSRRELTLLDGGPNSAPLAQPTVGALTLVAGRVRVPITAIPSGASCRVDYAVKTTAPVSGSGDWVYAGKLDANGSLDTPLIPDDIAATVWIRARSEGVNMRPSAYTAGVSIAIPQLHRAFGARMVIADSANPVVFWASNISGAGIRVYYQVFATAGDPGTTLTSFVDVIASAGQVTIPAVVKYSERILVAIEPWSGWTGSAVTGTATDRIQLVGQRLPADFIAPIISIDHSISGATGTLVVTVTDPTISRNASRISYTLGDCWWVERLGCRW
jgi:hypothetical protein